MDIDQPGTGNENLSDQGNALLDSCGSKRLKFVKGEPTSRHYVSTARVLHLPADLHRGHCCGACNRHSCPGSERKTRSRGDPYFRPTKRSAKKRHRFLHFAAWDIAHQLSRHFWWWRDYCQNANLRRLHLEEGYYLPSNPFCLPAST